MNKVLIAVLMAAVSVAVSAETKAKAESSARKGAAEVAGKRTSLADARRRIGEAIKDAKVMAELMKGLSAADQKLFLADVNKAIGELPASIEEKSALYLNANSAAMKSAAPDNLKTLVAETFATVPPEALTVIAERFAVDLFNRDAGGAGKYTDAQFTQIAVSTMKAINARTGETENGSARSTFAIVMFVRAANNTIPDLSDKLVETLESADAREIAKTELLPAALGEGGRTQSYEPLLAAADAGLRPDLKFVLAIAGPQHPESVLSDLLGKNTDELSFSESRTPILDAVDNKLIPQNPTLGADRVGQAGEAGSTAGGGAQEFGPHGENPRPTPDNPDPQAEPRPEPQPEPEPPHPDPYSGQMY